MKKNDVVELTIDGTTSDGAGVGHIGGAAVFVPGSAVGDRCEVRIVKVERSFFRGKLLRLIIPSPDRREESCPAAGKCGGCVFQHLTYEAELRQKWERVRDCLARIGGLPVTPEPVQPSPEVRHYRNKVILPVGERDGRPVIGFYAPRSHRIVDIRGCEIQNPGDDALARALLRYMEESGVRPYDERSGKGMVRHLFIRRLRSGEVCAMPVVRSGRLPETEQLCELLLEAEPGLRSILLNRNDRRDNVILGERCELLWGREYLEDTLCGLRFRLSPRSFYQINTPQCERLYAKVREYAALTGRETVCDLYCGIGTIGLSLAHEAGRLVGVEVVPEAVRDAKENAARNGIKNARFFCGGAEDFAEVFEGKLDVCIVDPPRKGCDGRLLDTIARMEPERLVYVSCDPATLARDLKILSGKGFAVREVTPFDMFPRSAHVECVALLVKGENG